MNERRIHRLFEISVLLKGVHAAIECIGGVALAFIQPGAILDLVASLTQDELAADPRDFVATHLLGWAQHFSAATAHFYAFYLISHGVVKLLLVIGLLRNRMWSYPAALIAMALFIVYQLYRFSYTQSWGLIALTIFDLLVIALIWHEWRLRRKLARIV